MDVVQTLAMLDIITQSLERFRVILHIFGIYKPCVEPGRKIIDSRDMECRFFVFNLAGTMRIPNRNK
jgi:hypothetical protein